MAIDIRAAATADEAAIHEVTRRAFLNAPHTSHTEHLIVDALRAAKQLSVSLVAENNGQIVGHVAISPINISDGSENWYGLGPVSVLPECQGQGIGTQLIQIALKTLNERGAAGCVVLGEPSYYTRFGFIETAGLNLPGVPKEYFLAQAFLGTAPAGDVVYHSAFNVSQA